MFLAREILVEKWKWEIAKMKWERGWGKGQKFWEKFSRRTARPHLGFDGEGNIGGSLRREGKGEDSHREGCYRYNRRGMYAEKHRVSQRSAF